MAAEARITHNKKISTKEIENEIIREELQNVYEVKGFIIGNY